MRRITITRARGGFIVEGNEDEEPTVATRLIDVLAAATSQLTEQEYAASLIGDVIILTPTGREEAYGRQD